MTDANAPGEAPVRGDALYLYGVLRVRAFRAPLRESGATGTTRVRYRELEAIVRAAPFAQVNYDEETLRMHQRVVEDTMRRTTVLPFPPGVVFRDRRELIRTLEDQYLVMDEALSFLEGHWEVRVHMGVRGDDEASPELRDLAAHVYAELRRMAHAAQPLAPRERRLLSAAFLVPRGVWVEFVERGEDLAATDPRLSLDITGPWPAYDFVRLVR
jgi:hypothetical protein